MVFKVFREKADYQGFLENSGSKLMVLCLHAPWCKTCQRVEPEMIKLSNEFPGVGFLRVDIDSADADDIVETYMVNVTPTCVLIKDKRQLIRFEGDKVADIREAIEKNK
uniref:Thioredoxin domain-containing protein n=1 Tax=Plectus sambesii TaxID=2011161 RepID=A0A914WZ09_9BILA